MNHNENAWEHNHKAVAWDKLNQRNEWTFKALKFTSLYDFHKWLTFAGGADEDDLFASDVDERLLSLKEFSVKRWREMRMKLSNKRSLGFNR